MFRKITLLMFMSSLGLLSYSQNQQEVKSIEKKETEAKVHPNKLIQYHAIERENVKSHRQINEAEKKSATPIIISPSNVEIKNNSPKRKNSVKITDPI